MNSAELIIGAIIIIGLLTATITLSMANQDQLPNMRTPQLTNGNPFTIGSYVYVMETDDRPELNWSGIVLGRNNGLVLIRDSEPPYETAHVNPEQIWRMEQ